MSRFLKSTLFLAGGLSLFLSGCLSGVTDEKAAVDSHNPLAVGMAAPATQPAELSGWTDADIGVVGQAGSSTLSGNSAIVRGSGADIWGPADGFHFKYAQPFYNSFMLTARVTGLQGTDPWAKAGIMFREDNTPGAPHVFLALTSGNGVAFQRRDVAGGESFHTGVAGGAPVWLRLKFDGGVITGFRSDDGENWTLVGQAANRVKRPGFVVGFAVTSHNNAALNAATFDNIAWVDGLVPAPWTAEDIGNVGLAGSTIHTWHRGGSTWVIEGAGDDIYNSADAFHFCHRPVIGDDSIEAYVVSPSNTHQWAKAGIMMRETTSPGSRFVFIGLTPSGVVEFLRREVEGGSTIAVAAPAGVGRRFLISRVGNVFAVFYMSELSSVWTPMGQVTMALKPEILKGLAVTSHDRSVLTRAIFGTTPYQ